MVVGHFLKWVETARVSERAAAASALARAYIGFDLPFEERCAAEAALTLLLDDPSARVRFALADALSMSRRAPLQVVSALAADQPEIAALVLARSPLFTDADLIDFVAASRPAPQRVIATRPSVSMALSAAIAEVGDVEACMGLVSNSGADIASLSFRRIAERHGDVARIRAALLADHRLPPDCRHLLLVKVGEALKSSRLVLASIGAARAERVTQEAYVKASIKLVERTSPEEHTALVEHMRLRGDLTPSFLVRMLAHGKVDFFGSVLIALTGEREARVRVLLGGGRDAALAALFDKAGVGSSLHGVLLCALKILREVAAGRREAGAQEVAWLMLLEVKKGPPELATLLKSIHLDMLRENAREHALAIAAA
jgi:uncharacterized protein (DUF2336 family)